MTNQNQKQDTQTAGTDAAFGLFQLIMYAISIGAGIVALTSM